MRGRLTHQHIDDLEIQRIQRAIAVVIKFVGGNRTISGDDEPVVDHHIGAIQVAIRALSGGNQQKVVLSKWIMANPKVLILDEPTRGVDVGAKSEIHTLMCKFAAQGMAIIMISSELPEVMGMSDRLLVYHEEIPKTVVLKQLYLHFWNFVLK